MDIDPPSGHSQDQSDPAHGQSIDNQQNKKSQNTKKTPSFLTANENNEALHTRVQDTDLKSRKYTVSKKNIDYFLDVNSEEKCNNIAENYLKNSESLAKTADAMAYDFLKKSQKIPIKHISECLFPYLALKYINNDKTKLADSLRQVFDVAKYLDIEDLSKISFEDIINLKHTLKHEYKDYSDVNLEANIEPDEPVENDKTPGFILPDDTSFYLDEVDMSYIKETSAVSKTSKKETINRVKRSLLNKRYSMLMLAFGLLFDYLMFFIIPAIVHANMYAIVSIIAITLLPVLYVIYTFSKDHIYIIIANRYINKNFTRGLEILNSNKEASAKEIKIIKKIREHYACLFKRVYSSEMRNLYAEIEKGRQQISLINDKKTKKVKDKIDIIKKQEKINIKEQSINEYLELYEKMYFFAMKELESNNTKLMNLLIPKLHSTFSKLTEEQIQQAIDKAVGSKNIKKKTDIINMLTPDTNVLNLDKTISEKIETRNIIVSKLLGVLSFFKDMSLDRLESGLLYSARVGVTSAITSKASMKNIIDFIKTPLAVPDLAFHGYYCFFFGWAMSSIEERFSSYRDAKSMLNIKLDIPEKTGLFWGLINPRFRTKREQVATIINSQKNNSMELLDLMDTCNDKAKEYIKLLNKKTIPAEKLIEILINFQYYHVQSVLLANNATAEFLNLMHKKIAAFSNHLNSELLEED